MAYWVFLFEVGVNAREGIRENVDWVSAGFEFCGDASDEEMALLEIEKTRPDVIIIHGLQLCKII
jgi:two-component system response regulator YesN